MRAGARPRRCAFSFSLSFSLSLTVPRNAALVAPVSFSHSLAMMHSLAPFHTPHTYNCLPPSSLLRSPSPQAEATAALVSASQEGDLAAVEDCLANGADVNVEKVRSTNRDHRRTQGH